MSATPFSLSISENCRTQTVTRLHFLKLADFAAFIKATPPVSDKLHSRGIIASLFNSNIRHIENITSVTSATLDFDQPSEGLFDAVTAILEGEGIAHVAFGTWSNHGRFAVIIPFAKPTSIAGHAATVEHLRTLLGGYAIFAPESSRAAQLRFVSANAANEYRQFNVFDGTSLEPIEPVEEAPSTSGSGASFDSFSEIAKPQEKHLFLLALRNNLLPVKRLDVYEDWYPVLFAGFRAWGIGKKRGDLSEHQLELIEALNQWSKNHEKWKPGCVEAKIGDHLRAGAKTMTIQSLLKVEVDQTRLRHFIAEESDEGDRAELSATFTRLLGGQSVTQVTHVDPTAIEEAQTQRVADLAKQDSERKWALGILSRMPAPTPRFAEFRDIVTELVTQGRHEFWELPSDDWLDFLRPVPMIMSLAQVAAMGFMPHTLFRQSDAIQAKALNLFFLHVARAGTGKSITLDIAADILAKTPYKHCNPREKLHSATGLWLNHFERNGNLQMMTSDEAESLFGKAGQQDQHLHALHTCIKQLFDGGLPGKTYRPSAQVQREIAELTAPTLLLNLAGTPALLNGDISGAMMHDGFMSRMVAYVNDAEPDNKSEEEIIKAKADMMAGKIGHNREKMIDRAVVFFRKLWKDAEHPQGPSIFDIPEDAEREFMINTIREHYENPDLEPRYIRPGKDYETIMKVATIAYRAQHRFTVPDSLRGTDAESNIESLQTRAELKLFMLTSVLTLIADPQAEYLNLELMEWAEEFLYVAQRDFYNHMLGNTAMTLSVLPKFRINPDMLKALRPAVLGKGPLHGGSLVKSSTMNNFSRPWRRLLADLKCDETSERFRCATELLIELGVAYQDGENNTRFFFIRPEAKD